VVIERLALGGPAGTSSLIRNYLGVARGVSGDQLAHRAWQQAVLFGAQFVFTHQAIGVTAGEDRHVVTLEDGSQAVARALIIATGVSYGVSVSTAWTASSARVFYGAAGVEAPAMAGQEVYVIGGANSAGQAALHLARFASRVSHWFVGGHCPRACPPIS
jgi:thioredoxin reductase (NADPH)